MDFYCIGEIPGWPEYSRIPKIVVDILIRYLDERIHNSDGTIAFFIAENSLRSQGKYICPSTKAL